MSAQSWIKFYPSDWRGDVRLQACSLAARGLWIELMCLMYEATPYGHLLIDGQPPSYYRISQLVSTDHRVVKNLVAELQKAGVFAGDFTSGITSRRMVRDKAKSLTARELSKKRWGQKTYAPETRKNRKGPTNKKASRQHQAEQAWQRHLLSQQGSAVFSVAIEKLAAHPEIVERATRAEIRKPGSGALVAMLGLSHEPAP